jgi:hypothetical protein
VVQQAMGNDRYPGKYEGQEYPLTGETLDFL